MDNIRRRTLNEQVLTALAGAILSGELAEGMKLPAEKELAASFAVSRNTLREAIRKLEIFGVLESRHGQGTFVSACAKARIPNIGIIRGLSENADVRALLDARLALEPGLAELAAERRSERDLEDLASHVSCLIGTRGNASPESLFHYRVARAARSEIACRFMALLLSQLCGAPYPSPRDRTAPDYEAREIAEHERILAFIRAGDGEGARRAMQAHLRERRTLPKT